MKIEKDKVVTIDNYFSKIQSRLNPIVVQPNADKNYHFSNDDSLYIQYVGKDKE